MVALEKKYIKDSTYILEVSKIKFFLIKDSYLFLSETFSALCILSYNLPTLIIT